MMCTIGYIVRPTAGLTGQRTGKSQEHPVMQSGLNPSRFSLCQKGERLLEQLPDRAENLKGVSYDVYVEGKGWVQAENGAEAGTTGEGKRMEALRMYVGDGTYTGSIQYQTYVQTYGWRNLASAGNVSGAENSGKRMEALKINLTGELGKTL